MKVHIDNVPRIISEYLITVIVPKMPSKLLQFGLAFGAYSLSSQTAQKLNSYLPTIKMLGIVDDSNFIDLDNFEFCATKALEQAGHNIELYGYVVDKDDISSLIKIAQKYSVQ